ncbi:MAG TPA: permease [Anaerohalosphaeraceae bacterium]|nr:permease [Phycisphaerae bacterium]HOL32421.1 permease [Anaerohalosphaeraceae bacterium]HOM75970.1 permease [Anaerohalosphaeraceae bacterium]HPC62988.1 permease [Anaerohalosphaeraceae bacterium]HPO69459.1 permease [Anaerohalosphaeraceae bacterium]
MVEFFKTVIADFWGTLSEMSPYLLFGFFAAGLVGAFINAQQVERHLGGSGFWQVFKASLFGVPLPLCSCGVIPVSMSLYNHGASRGATVSFLLSTPQTGIDSIVVTYGMMGPIFAVFRPLAAFLTGLIGGIFTNVFDHSPQPAAAPKPDCPDCAAGRRPSRLIYALKHGFITLPADIGTAMLAGIIIAALISALVPDDFFAGVLSTAGGGFVAMLAMMAMGIPVYVCATASVPIAVSLIDKGLNPGAALVFLMTGPATNAAALSILWNKLGPRSAVIYLLTTAGCALAGGLVLDAIFRGDISTITHAHGAMLPQWMKTLSAIVLLAALANGIIRSKRRKEKTAPVPA